MTSLTQEQKDLFAKSIDKTLPIDSPTILISLCLPLHAFKNFLDCLVLNSLSSKSLLDSLIKIINTPLDIIINKYNAIADSIPTLYLYVIINIHTKHISSSKTSTKLTYLNESLLYEIYLLATNPEINNTDSKMGI